MICEAPTGRTEADSKFPSSKTQNPVEPPPMSRTKTPSSFWRFERTASPAARVEKTKFPTDFPQFSMAFIRLLMYGEEPKMIHDYLNDG